MFQNFPTFTPLTIDLKDTYNKLIDEFPPYSDISFVTLQIWWNLNEKLSISILNGNLVIDYVLPFDIEQSGFGLVGKNDVEKSIETIFKYLEKKQKPIQLVHVPEFVVNEIKNRNQFNVDEEQDYNEYLLDSEALAKLEGPEYKRFRKKIKFFEKGVGERELEIKALDLSIEIIQDQLMETISGWETKNKPRNDPEHTEHLALRKTLSNASQLDIKNLALYIDKELKGIIIYHQPSNKEYFVIHHAKINYETPYISDYLHHEIAKHATKNKVSNLNIEMDLGIENLKNHKMLLKPSGFFKKYTISPKKI